MRNLFSLKEHDILNLGCIKCLRVRRYLNDYYEVVNEVKGELNFFWGGGIQPEIIK